MSDSSSSAREGTSVIGRGACEGPLVTSRSREAAAIRRLPTFTACTQADAEHHRLPAGSPTVRRCGRFSPIPTFLVLLPRRV